MIIYVLILILLLFKKFFFVCNFDLGLGVCGMDFILFIGNNVGWNIIFKIFIYLGYIYIFGDFLG